MFTLLMRLGLRHHRCHGNIKCGLLGDSLENDVGLRPGKRITRVSIACQSRVSY